MQPTRRTLLTATGALLVAAATPIVARADAPAPASDKNLADPHMADRALGSPDAKVTAEEWFSFTCPHCARFQADVFPLIQAQLIDTGKLRYVFHEYPRDQVDLTAAMVARSLPPSRYVPFVETLLASQPRWAFDRSVDPKDEIAKMAALAGMPREMFDKVLADDALKAAILDAQSKAEAAYSIDSTPTFIINGHVHSGEADIDTFKKWVGA
jgi:protein-disulfide isomerase